MTAPPLILLDLDGVIVPSGLLDHDHPDVRWRLTEITELAGDIGARIVVSSTWRVQSDLPDWLATRGLPKDMLWNPWRTPLAASTVDPLTGDILNPRHLSRSEEIAAFLSDHGVSRYLVFDDDDMDRPMMSSQIKPDPRRGIGRAHIDVARSLASRWRHG